MKMAHLGDSPMSLLFIEDAYNVTLLLLCGSVFIKSYKALLPQLQSTLHIILIQTILYFKTTI